MEKTYKIKANKELFNRWNSLNDLSVFKSIIQNDMELSHIEVDQWVKDVHEAKEKLNEKIEDLIDDTLEAIGWHI